MHYTYRVCIVTGTGTGLEPADADHPELAGSAARLPANEVAQWLADDPALQVVDVRNPGETKVGGMVPGARNVPLPQLLDHLDDLDRDAPTVVYCAGGYRSSVAASLLRAHGFGDVSDIVGGYGAWNEVVQPA